MHVNHRATSTGGGGIVFRIQLLAAACGLGIVGVPLEASATLYMLDDGSTYQHGCFPPCLCPLLEEADLRGTFELTFIGFDGLFWNYAVTDVAWTASLGDPGLPIAGSGTYKVGGEFVSAHELNWT